MEKGCENGENSILTIPFTELSLHQKKKSQALPTKVEKASELLLQA
uniref:Uncharacterized protein n=1 Tax=Lotus japonicus TaxID=34305 RepID=I3S9M5_LOTJA|nr:unknown [Lotus japonicus]